MFYHRNSHPFFFGVCLFDQKKSFTTMYNNNSRVALIKGITYEQNVARGFTRD